jgi:hypothetical protein
VKNGNPERVWVRPSQKYREDGESIEPTVLFLKDVLNEVKKDSPTITKRIISLKINVISA